MAKYTLVISCNMSEETKVKEVPGIANYAIFNESYELIDESSIQGITTLENRLAFKALCKAFETINKMDNTASVVVFSTTKHLVGVVRGTIKNYPDKELTYVGWYDTLSRGHLVSIYPYRGAIDIQYFPIAVQDILIKWQSFSSKNMKNLRKVVEEKRIAHKHWVKEQRQKAEERRRQKRKRKAMRLAAKNE